MLDGMSSRELSEWFAYFQLEPFGEEREDYRTALIAQTVANTAPRKRRKAFKLHDFLLRFGRQDADEDDDGVERGLALKAKWEHLVAMWAGLSDGDNRESGSDAPARHERIREGSERRT